ALRTWMQLTRERAAKAHGAIMSLATLRMNATGWAPAASANVYRSFVRPVLEYGVALKKPSPGAMMIYEAAQPLALR
ncbi:hypothetical protein HDU84_000253, partial [Entophlyctis sp. JEL0112]